MPRGIFLVGWDDTLGCILRSKFPPEVDLSSDAMLQYLATVQALGKSPTIQVQDENQSTLIYGIPPSATKAGSRRAPDLIVLQLSEGDLGKIKRFTLLLSAEGKGIITAPRPEQEGLFLKLARQVFQPPARKVVFMGFPDSGKTSTRLFFFEKIRDGHLLATPLEPTLGVDTISYHWLDLDVALFDTSGQELDRWFEDREGVTSGSDLIVFFFTMSDWKRDSQKVRSYLERLAGRGQPGEEGSRKIIIFCHKADLLTAGDVSCQEEILSFTGGLHLPTFFTSITGGGNEDLAQGMHILVREFSHYLKDIQTLLNPLISKVGVQPLFLIDSGERFLADYYTTDPDLLTTIHRVRAFYPGALDLYATTFHQSSNYLVFSLPGDVGAIMCLNCSQLGPDLGYIFLKGSSLSDLQSFCVAWQDLVKSLRWERRGT